MLLTLFLMGIVLVSCEYKNKENLYDNETHTNVDATEYNFDSAQFSDLIMAIETTGWEISY